MDMRVAAIPREVRDAVADLYQDYASALDAMDLHRWTGFFTEDAMYRVIARESFALGLTHATIYCDGLPMIRDRATMLEKVSVYEPRVLRHFLSGMRVLSATQDTITATGSFLVIESLFDAEPHILMVGEYIDEIAARDGQLLFRRRDAVYDQYRVRTTMVIPV